MQEEFLMVKDIKEEPIVLESVANSSSRIKRLAEKISMEEIKRVFFIGCGSSYYAAIFGAWPLLSTNLPVYISPSSEFLFYYIKLIDDKSLVIGLSRSGQTAETLLAMEKACERKAFTLAFTICHHSDISRKCKEHFATETGMEKSIITTKSFVALSLASAIFSATLGRLLFNKDYDFLEEISRLSSSAKKILEREKDIYELAQASVNNRVERFVFLGSGPAYPIALEGALKVKETSYVASEAFHTLEFRHGPISTIGEKQVLFLIACNGESFAASKRLFNEIREKSGDIILLTNSPPEEPNTAIVIPSVKYEENAALLSIIPIQLFSYYYSVGIGKNPDEPRNLSRYIERF